MIGSAQHRNNATMWLLLLAFIGVSVMSSAVLADSQGSGADSAVAASQPAPTQDPRALGRTLRNVLYILLVLVVLFTVSSYAFILWSRRYRRWLLRHPARPTPHADVWPMHKLPPEEGEDENSQPYENNDR
jgi:hypothetical protein